jgi:membrane-associated phospholipid phosphatase
LVRARIPGLRGSLTFAELFRSDPFNLLEEGPNYTLSGLCGRIWTVRRDFARLSQPAEFLTWRAPGTVRVLFATWTEPTEGGSALVSEVRIAAVDRRAGLHVQALRPFISAFQGLVATEPLRIAAQRAGRASKPGDHEPRRE